MLGNVLAAWPPSSSACFKNSSIEKSWRLTLERYSRQIGIDLLDLDFTYSVSSLDNGPYVYEEKKKNRYEALILLSVLFYLFLKKIGKEKGK